MKATYSLKDYNTFKIAADCSNLLNIHSVDQLNELTKDQINECFILGGGSNILILNDISRPVLKINIKGIEVLSENDESVHIKVGAGENWSEFVDFCCKNEYYGIENMALIPGTVGAGPIQNIGAYGREVKDVIHSVTYFDKTSMSLKSLNVKECNFGYRDSIFKNELKDKFIITSVEYILSKIPTFYLDYGPLKAWREQFNGPINALEIAEQVKAIRRSKLPDPEKIGNGGSFFKNPVISIQHFQNLQVKYPQIPYFSQGEDIKIPAAWLIEKAGWKGYRENDYGVHEHQALVLVNYGNASGTDIFKLSERIIDSVFTEFNIKLEREINIIS